MNLSIQPTKDYETLAYLNQQVQEMHHQLYPEVFKPFELMQAEEFFKSMLLSDNTYAYLALDNDKPIGYIFGLMHSKPATAFQYSRPTLLIDQILVLESYRKQGVARQLLECAMQLARTNNLQEVELEHWKNNTGAQSFFTKNGFGPVKHKLIKRI